MTKKGALAFVGVMESDVVSSFSLTTVEIFGRCGQHPGFVFMHVTPAFTRLTTGSNFRV